MVSVKSGSKVGTCEQRPEDVGAEYDSYNDPVPR